MNKCYIFFIAFLLIPVSVSVVEGTEEFYILDKQVEIRIAHLTWTHKIQEIRLQAAVSYIHKISNGQGIALLSEYLTNYIDTSTEIGSLTTHAALNAVIRQLQHITNDFRRELRSQMTMYNGRVWALREHMQTAVSENATLLTMREDAYWATRQQNEVDIFDRRVHNAQQILDILANRGYNTTAAQEKLDEIVALRSALVDALNKRDNSEIHAVNLQILARSQELRDLVHELQIVVPEKKRIEFWLRVGERVVNRTETIIAELASLGFNVTELRTLHGVVVEDLAYAQQLYNEGDFSGALNALHEVRDDLKALRDAYRDLITGGLPSEAVEAMIEQVSEALTDTIDAMETSV